MVFTMADVRELSPDEAGGRRVLYENDPCLIGSLLPKREGGFVESPPYDLIRGKKLHAKGSTTNLSKTSTRPTSSHEATSIFL